MILTIMKRTLLLLVAVILYGCDCIAQIPTQYVYLDTTCTAVIPDYEYLVVVRDNCDNPVLTQQPPPGTVITHTTTVTFIATDSYGNGVSTDFQVVVLDTIPPTIQLNENWTGYSDKEVGDMYRTFYGWVQLNNTEWNRLYAGQPQYIPEFDTTIINDTVRFFTNTILVPDYTRNEWWWGIAYLN